MSQLSVKQLETSLKMGCTAGSNSPDEIFLMVDASQLHLLLNCIIQNLLIPSMGNVNESLIFHHEYFV
jgi:hypothetical protein